MDTSIFPEVNPIPVPDFTYNVSPELDYDLRDYKAQSTSILPT
jgi:hypothetical protein